MHNIGLYPFQDFLFPHGFNNMFPQSIKPYIPKLNEAKSNEPFFRPAEFNELSIDFGLGIRATPDSLFSKTKTKIYKIITTGNDINNLFEFHKEGYDFSSEEIYKGMNCLQAAAYFNSFEAVHFLLNIAKIDINIKNSDGYSALNYAIDSGNELMVKYLLHNKAKLDIYDQYGIDNIDKLTYKGYDNDFIDILKNKEKYKKKSFSKHAKIHIQAPLDRKTLSSELKLPSSILMTHMYNLNYDKYKPSDDYINTSNCLSVYFVRDFRL